VIPAGDRPVRVLAIDHAAGVPPIRKRHAAIAAHPGIELTVLAPERWIENSRVINASPGLQDGFRVLTGRVGWAGYENRGFFRTGLAEALRVTRPDILHLWEEPFSLLALQALLAAERHAPGASVLFYSADNVGARFRYPYRPSWLYAAIERFTHRRCVRGTAVSAEVERVLRAKGFAKPVDVIPLGVDLADYPTEAGTGPIGRARRASEGEVRARFGLEPPVVGYVGRLLPIKGVDVLLHAAARQRNGLPQGRPFSLVIIGDGPERGGLERLARELGLAARTRFLPGVPHPEVPALVAAIEVLVLPSRTLPRAKEQFGRVLIEAMAAGACVVGTSSGGIPDTIGDAGLVVPEEDPGALASAVTRLLADSGLRERLRDAGRARVRERYTWEAVAAKVVRIYHGLAAGRAAPVC
jgi:glycosyltransferase involved in cell wall biosynthesis